jgi:hypothetical protein
LRNPHKQVIMFIKTSLPQFYQQVDRAIAHNLSATGFGSLGFELQDNCNRSSLVRLRNTVHYGFELDRSDLAQLRRSSCPFELQAQHLPLWEHLHGSFCDIWDAQGHGNVSLDFSRVKRDRGAVVLLQGGPSYRIQLPPA